MPLVKTCLFSLVDKVAELKMFKQVYLGDTEKRLSIYTYLTYDSYLLRPYAREDIA